MRKIDRRAALLALLALASSACPDARADRGSPAPYGSSASPSASVSALPPESQPKEEAGRKPWVWVGPTDPIPETKSDPPTNKEWESAPAAPEVRRTQDACTAKRIREWYRLSCGGVGINLVAGNRDGVDIGIRRIADSNMAEETSIVFPARRGDSRIFQIFSWSRWAPGDPDAILTEQWIEGDPYPVITLQGLRWGF